MPGGRRPHKQDSSSGGHMPSRGLSTPSWQLWKCSGPDHFGTRAIWKVLLRIAHISHRGPERSAKGSTVRTQSRVPGPWSCTKPTARRGWPPVHTPPLSASRVLGFQACASRLSSLHTSEERANHAIGLRLTTPPRPPPMPSTLYRGSFPRAKGLSPLRPAR